MHRSPAGIRPRARASHFAKRRPTSDNDAALDARLMFCRESDGLLVFTGIPFALTGGIAALWLCGLQFSISAAVGFIVLSGVALLAARRYSVAIRRCEVPSAPHSCSLRGQPPIIP